MLNVYRKIYDILSPRDRTWFLALCAMSLVLGLAEAGGVLSVVPFVAIAADESVVERSALLAWMKGFLGFDENRSFMIFLGILSFVALVSAIAFRALTFALVTRFVRLQFARFGELLMGRYLQKDYLWFVGRHSADINKSILSEVEQVVDGSLTGAIQFLAHAAVAASLSTLLLIADPVAALSIAGFLGLSYGLIFFALRKRLHRLGEERMEMNRQRFEVVQEAIGGIRAVKLHHLEDWFLKRYAQAALGMAQVRTRTRLLSDLPAYALEMLVFGGMILFVLWVLISRNETLVSSLPILSLFAVAGVRLFPVLQQLYASFATFRSNAPALDELHRIIMTETDVPREPEPDAAPMTLKKQLVLEGVEFGFEGVAQPTLRDLSLSIDAGTKVGIVGATGAGKSTLADLILGLIQPDSGTIRIDGVPLTRSNLRAWQKSVGYVPQVIHLANDTIAGNIAFGVAPAEIDMERIRSCLSMAALDSFVASLPEGILTKVGERGVRLSGGQRQRIGIARALYRNPDLIVFDEATSALDNSTEGRLLAEIELFSRNRTIVMIAHRLTTLRGCDVIHVLDNGRIEASGTYGDLLERSPTFRAMHSLAASETVL